MPERQDRSNAQRQMRSALAARAIQTQSESIDRRFALAATTVAVVLIVSTVGYVLIEGASWFDAFYMAVITVTTVGYGEVFPLDTAGRVFTIFVTLFGVGTILYVASLLAEYVLSGQLGGMIGQRRMNRQIAGLNGHYVVCGYGRTGRRVSDELRREGRGVIVVDASEQKVGQAIVDGFSAVLGDTGNDDVLRQAGIERAAGLVAAVSPDSDVLMTVLSARALNKGLSIVAKADFEDSESKMKAAGADRVISVYRIAGHRMAQMVIRPDLADFLEVVLTDHEVEIEMDMVKLAEDSPYDELTLGQSGLQERTTANIVGIRKHGGGLTAQATSGTKLNSGDVLLAIGTLRQLEDLKKAAGVSKG
jgi:voltage-gated potassium channel